MLKINFYRFPEEKTPRERALICKQVIENKKIAEIPTYISEEYLNRNFPRDVQCSLPMAKKLLKNFGGYAYTEHIDRDGGLVNKTPILLTL